MNRVLLAGLCFATLLSSLSLVACDPATDPPDQRSLAGRGSGRNVLLLTVDTVRADRLGAYGYDLRETSPRIDELLARGLRFDRAMAPRSMTWPSLATLLSGLYPSGHGVTENGYLFPEDLETLPRRLQTAGYRTGAFLSNMCKAGHSGWDAFACNGGRDGRTIDAAVEWLESTRADDDDRPVFLWVHLFAAHGPYYNGGDRAARTLDPGYEGPIGTKKWMLDRVTKESLELAPADIEHLDAVYDAAIMGTDSLVGRLLDGLGLQTPPPSSEKELGTNGQADSDVTRSSTADWIIVFTSDHGEELYGHNRYLYHACSVYQTTLHVPLGIVAEGLIPPGTVAESIVELADVAPTLIDLLAQPPLPESQGVSLTRMISRSITDGETIDMGKPAFSEYSGLPIHTVLDGSWKLVSNPTGVEPFCIPGAQPGHYPIGTAELYDLASDPLELRNLAQQEPAIVERLLGEIERFRGRVERRRGPQDVDSELKEELEALGYVAN